MIIDDNEHEGNYSYLESYHSCHALLGRCLSLTAGSAAGRFDTAALHLIAALRRSSA